MSGDCLIQIFVQYGADFILENGYFIEQVMAGCQTSGG